MAARHASLDSVSLDAHMLGAVETEDKLVVGKGLKQTFHLIADEKDREHIQRVLDIYADGCPVARSIKDSIEITSELDLTIKS